MQVYETKYIDKKDQERTNRFYVMDDAERNDLDHFYPLIKQQYEKIKSEYPKKLNKYDSDALIFLGKCRNYGEGNLDIDADAGQMMDLSETQLHKLVSKMLNKVMGFGQAESILDALGFGLEEVHIMSQSEAYQNMERKRRIKERFENQSSEERILENIRAELNTLKAQVREARDVSRKQYDTIEEKVNALVEIFK